jgi:membrane dipeptidase
MAIDLKHARELLREHPIIDGHNDLPWAIRTDPEAQGDLDRYDLCTPTRGDTDLPRLRAGGVGGQFWSVFVPGDSAPAGHEPHYARTQLEQIDLARRLTARYADDLTLCLAVDDVERAMRGGRIASMLGMEGGHVLEGSLGVLRAFHQLGARYLTLTHNQSNELADSATDEPRHGGLSPFGREVVAEMNRLGMLVDLSHVAPSTMSDALDVSAAPVIFSHSSARALCDVPRNVPDDILRRVPDNGGIVMVTFVAGFIGPEAAAVLVPALAEFRQRVEGIDDPEERRAIRAEVLSALEVPRPRIGLVADHIEHVARVAGHDHVGIGADFDGNEFWPEELDDVSCYPNLFAELIRRGWTDANLAKLASGNILRVMRDVEVVAGRPS